MAGLTRLVFDETIVGTGVSWYSSEEHGALLTSADSYTLIAHVSNASGTTPTFSVFLETSSDARHWFAASTLLSAQSVANEAVYKAGFAAETGFARLRVTLGGTSPRCRLTLGVTGRYG